MATLPVLNGLGVTSFNSETLGLLVVLIGAIVASLGSVFTAIYMEARVTPISNPMTMSFTPLTPITPAEISAAEHAQHLAPQVVGDVDVNPVEVPA